MVNETARAAAVTRLHELYIDDKLSIESLGERLDAVLGAADDAGLTAAISALPPPVALTHEDRRLTAPLIVRVPGCELGLAPGWQLAADTRISTGPGRALVDLTAASWDALQVDLRLETWGTLDVFVPRGVAVRVAGRTSAIRVEPMAAPLPGGPLLSVCNAGPGGQIRIRHPAANRRSTDNTHEAVVQTIRVGAVNSARRFAALWLS
jgi:hypothetical protein